MRPIHFAHANGFPAPVYRYFFSQLAPYKISYTERFGHGDFKVNNHWSSLVDELIASIEAKHKEPVIGVGHSLGAVLTIFAAEKRPDLFEQIIIMDPPVMGWKYRVALYLSKKTGLIDRILPVAKKAKSRREDFKNRDLLRRVLKGKKLFADFHPECFEDYIQYGFNDTESGVTLAFKKQVEYEVFCNIPDFFNKTSPGVPATYIYAERGEIAETRKIEDIMPLFGNVNFMPFNGGHLFPLEQPHKVANFIKEIIKEQTKE